MVPDEVIGLPDTLKMLGRVRPAEVTVPEEAVAHAGAPPDRVSTWPFEPAATWPIEPDVGAYNTPFAVYEERLVPPRAIGNTPVAICEASRSGMEDEASVGMRAGANTPLVIFDASRFGMEEVESAGMSEAAIARKDGVPFAPAGAANMVPAVCDASVISSEPDEVIGLPATARNDGTVAATDVTVPALAAAHAGAPDTVVSTSPFAPAGIRARENVPLDIFEASIDPASMAFVTLPAPIAVTSDPADVVTSPVSAGKDEALRVPVMFDAVPVVFWFKVGTSAATKARKVGDPFDPFGAAKKVFAV